MMLLKHFGDFVTTLLLTTFRCDAITAAFRKDILNKNHEPVFEPFQTVFCDV
jgi:hypothetical protein